jgi:two-component system response regulator HydG
MLERIARHDAPVLLVGESGTGKELAARALHDRGPRSKGPFVAINCAAVPDALLESELFGHVKGAFTDARGSRAGLFAQAHGGTLFLDEIGDMPEGLQVKLLRTLQERKVRPVGGDREVPVDVRLVTATHRDLERLVEEGRFRHDLLYRLDVIRVELPPLRRRGRDVLLLTEHFVDQYARRLEREAPEVPANVAQLLLDYDWPGNVRELQNCVERLVVLADGDAISEGDLPPRIRRFRAREHTVIASTADPASLLPLAEVERRYVLEVLRASGGSRSLAAKLLGIDRKTLYRKLARWGAAPEAEGGPAAADQSSSQSSS